MGRNQNPQKARPADPFQVLGIDGDATPEVIRRAYLRRIKESPPERNPEEFERIRDAYKTLQDPAQRIQRTLFRPDPYAPLTDVLDTKEDKRFVGPETWLAVIAEGIE
jgi:hypothetical protein